jgi:hypothetical protein
MKEPRDEVNEEKSKTKVSDASKLEVIRWAVAQVKIEQDDDFQPLLCLYCD